MREIKDGMQCDLGFGSSAADIIAACRSRGSLPNIKFIGLNNPTPTGDHWHVIEWVTNFRKRGQSYLEKVPHKRRDFVKKAAAALDSGAGFSMEIVSMAARKFRDNNNLRMQRGKVYAFISLPLPSENGAYKDQAGPDPVGEK